MSTSDTKQLLDLLRDAQVALDWQQMADADPSAAERKGYYDVARERAQIATRRIKESGVLDEQVEPEFAHTRKKLREFHQAIDEIEDTPLRRRLDCLAIMAHTSLEDYQIAGEVAQLRTCPLHRIKAIRTVPVACMFTDDNLDELRGIPFFKED